MKLKLVSKVNKTATDPKDWRDKYDYVGDFHEGLAAVHLNYKRGFVDKTGKEVVPPKYAYVDDFYGGLAKVYLNGKWGWVTKEGKELFLTKDQHKQVKILLALGSITNQQLFEWIKKEAV